MTNLATIYATADDRSHEQIVGDVITASWPQVELFPTPKFFPFDFHVIRTYNRKSSDYLGGLEVKWFNHDSTRAGVFNYNKLLQLIAMTLHRDDPTCHHRIAFRYTDGILIVPARELTKYKPEVFTRRDTGETDLVVRVVREDLSGAWIDVQT
jgi:hypothetical protein